MTSIVHHQRVKESLVLEILNRIARQRRICQHNAPLGAIGSAGGRGDGHGRRPTGVVLDERITHAAQQLVPELAAIGTEVDAFAAESGVDVLEIAGGIAEGIEITAVLIQHHVGGIAGAHLLPMFPRINAAPEAAVCAAGERGIYDHIAGGRRLWIDHDLKARCAHENVIAQRRVNRQHIALSIRVHRGIEQFPARAAVHAAQEAHTRASGVAFAGGHEDDRPGRVVAASEDGDPADVDSKRRGEIGQRHPGGAGDV